MGFGFRVRAFGLRFLGFKFLEGLGGQGLSDSRAFEPGGLGVQGLRYRSVWAENLEDVGSGPDVTPSWGLATQKSDLTKKILGTLSGLWRFSTP